MFEKNLSTLTFGRISNKEISRPLIASVGKSPDKIRGFLFLRLLQNEFILTPDPRGLENTIRSSGSQGHTFPITGIGSGQYVIRLLAFFRGTCFPFSTTNFIQGGRVHEKAVAKLSTGVFNHRNNTGI